MRVSLSGGSVNVEYLPLGARSTSSSASSRQDSAASSSSTSPIRTPQRPSADQYRAEGNGKDVALDESVMGSRISRAAGLVPPNTFKPLYGSCGSHASLDPHRPGTECFEQRGLPDGRRRLLRHASGA